ncbi:MAG: TonB family protein [Nitrospirota bacterium]|nr:TonB family protein [Nitrospirota bacterium]
MQPFAQSILTPADRLPRMVGWSFALHMGVVVALMVADLLIPKRFDFTQAIQVTLVTPTAPEVAPDATVPEPDKPSPENPLWDKLDKPPQDQASMTRHWQELQRQSQSKTPPLQERPEDQWWRDISNSTKKPRPEAAQPAPQQPSMAEALRRIQAGQQGPETAPSVATGELSQWLDSQIALVLSPSDVAPERIGDIDRYKAVVTQRIDSRWSPPDLFRGKGARAVIAFVIERDGRVHSVRVKESSGSEHYDQTAMRAVLTSGPFPPIPEAWRSPAMEVSYVFDFKPDRVR